MGIRYYAYAFDRDQTDQALTGQLDDVSARPAHRMFEGEVTWTERGHLRWVRTLRPGDVPEIAHDLSAIGASELARLPELGFLHRDLEEEISYVGHFLGRARAFMSTLAQDGRGMVYMIG